MDDGLSTVEIEDVDIELPGNVVHDLMAAVNPLQLSNSYRIGVFIDCLNFLQSCMSSWETYNVCHAKTNEVVKS